MISPEEYLDITGEPYLGAFPEEGDIVHLGEYGYCKVTDVSYINGSEIPSSLVAQQLNEAGRWVAWEIQPWDFYQPATIH